LNGDDAPAIAFDDLRSRLLSICQTEIGDYDVGARLGKSLDYRTTNTARAARYDYRFIFEVLAHGWFLLVPQHIY
jgi:hypothetical protein